MSVEQGQFPSWFQWGNYENLYELNKASEWALLFAERSKDKHKLGEEISITRTHFPNGDVTAWQMEWSHGVLCRGMNGSLTNERIEQLEAQGRSLMLAIDVSAPIDKKQMLAEVERLYDKAIDSWAWSRIDKSKPLKRATTKQWARGLACFDLLQDGWSKYKIAKNLAPKWSNRELACGEPDSTERTKVERALEAVSPMIEGGWKELSYHPVTKK